MYREALADFLDKWLWEDTKDADWALSYLNRHYILHGMGNEHYYRSEDCHRLFMFLDLYIEMLVLETGVGEHVFIPEDPGIKKRARHYGDVPPPSRYPGATSIERRPREGCSLRRDVRILVWS